MPTSRQAGAPAHRDPNHLQALIEANLAGTRSESSRALAMAARVQGLRPGELLFRQDEPIPLTLIVDGHLAFRRTTIDGQQILTGVGYPGEIFGVTSAAVTTASTEFIALTDAVVATWTGSEFRAIVANDPDLALVVIDRLALFLNVTNEKIDGFLHQDARRRVMRVLARHRDLFFADEAVLSRTHLAGLVGTSREMTSRVVRGLEREGIVARIGRTGLRLLDPAALDEVSDMIPPGPITPTGRRSEQVPRPPHLEVGISRRGRTCGSGMGGRRAG
jgi:CRP/FNR family transcriptional regulator